MTDDWDLDDEPKPRFNLKVDWDVVARSLEGVSNAPETHAPDAPQLTETDGDVRSVATSTPPETQVATTETDEEAEEEITAFIEAIESLDRVEEGPADDGLTLFGANDDFRQAWQEWKGMPEFNQADLSPYRSIMVHFADQAAVDAFAVLMDQKLPQPTSSRGVWYPKPYVAHFVDKVYVSDLTEEDASE